MRHAFLLRTIALGILLAFGSHASEQVTAVLGDWHLIEASADSSPIPEHRMDLRFQNSAGGLRGAILSRRDGSEIALANSEFDGSTLRFQLRAPDGRAQTEMPIMMMTRVGDNFEGMWTDSAGQAMGPRLKLVRASQ
jgi:hypothetical protein